MRPELFGAYRPGHTVVHRAPLWIKWTLIAACAFACALTRGWVVPATVLCCVLLAGAAARMPVRQVIATVFALKWLLLAMAVYYLLSQKLALGAEVILTLLSLILASNVLLFTTAMPRLIEGFVRCCSPLKFLGLSPESIGLSIALMIRSIPVIMERWNLLQTAVRARGLRVGPARLFTPLVVTTVAYAQETGDALSARGLDTPEDEHRR
ncbi:energy-coupling factor transporter transmembrane protein EcfT [Rothia sp. LK2588]|uniref:energy-coupling factor transporter transmembrane protein EcfT n=1 Tax=Rothia sp. LK2588 TaxID=3114369 RepID=UPI0034CF2AB3